MNLETITPLVLTRDERPNVERLLDGLGWARRIVVIDSGSEDGTLEALAADPRVEVFHRDFDGFAAQCNFGLSKVDTEWVLSLDADYVCPPALAEEIAALPDRPEEDGFEARFRYVVHGRPLRGSLYPPRTVLYRREAARYADDGHAHRVRVDGPVGRLRTRIRHDDRKPLGPRWLAMQWRYAREEARKLEGAEELHLTDRVRAWGLGPVAVPLYCLFGKGLVLDGRAGLHYTLQRTVAEVVLALALVDRRLRGAGPDGGKAGP